MLAGQKTSPATPQAWIIPNVQCAFLDSIRLRDGAAILEAARLKKLAPKHPLFQSGDRASHLYLLKSGRVKFYKLTPGGQQILLRWLSPGDVFGLGTLLKTPQGYMGSAETVHPCEVYVWDHQRIRALAREYPQLAENAFRIVLNYLRAYVDRHIGLSTMNAQERLASLLVNLSTQSGRVSPKGVEIDATNEQLSSLSDMTPFTASRILSSWHRKGTITKKRGKILVEIPENLLEP